MQIYISKITGIVNLFFISLIIYFTFNGETLIGLPWVIAFIFSINAIYFYITYRHDTHNIHNNIIVFALLIFIIFNITFIEICKHPYSFLWKLQIEFAKDVNRYNQIQKIKFIGYKEIGEIDDKTTKDLLIEQLFSTKSAITYTKKDSAGHDYNEIDYIGNINLNDTAFQNLKVRIHRTKEWLQKNVSVGMKLLSIKWEYEGKEYNSISIVSDQTNEIIYDNIGSFSIGKRITYDSRNINIGNDSQ